MPTDLNLYQLTRAQLEAEEALCDLEGDALKEAIQKHLELHDRALAKVDRSVEFVQDVEEHAEAMRKKARFYTQRARTLENLAEGCRDWMKFVMGVLQIKRLVGEAHSATVQDNSKASLDVYDSEAIPKEFWVTPAPQVDEDAVRAALESGREVAGARLTRGQHVRLR